MSCRLHSTKRAQRQQEDRCDDIREDIESHGITKDSETTKLSTQVWQFYLHFINVFDLFLLIKNRKFGKIFLKNSNPFFNWQTELTRIKVALLREQLEAEIDRLRALKHSADDIDNCNQDKGLFYLSVCLSQSGIKWGTIVITQMWECDGSCWSFTRPSALDTQIYTCVFI